MRYSEVCEYFAAFCTARDTVSREWSISKSTVMCVQFDLGSAAAMKVSPIATLDANAANLVRTSYFDTVGLPVSLSRLTKAELGAAMEMQRAVNRWICGETAELPPSTSTQLAERFKR